MVLVVSVVLCLLGAGGGYFAVDSGMLPLPGPSKASKTAVSTPVDHPEVAFVPIPTLIVTLPPNAENRHLRFTGQIHDLRHGRLHPSGQFVQTDQ